jgi:hypothetical protein
MRNTERRPTVKIDGQVRSGKILGKGKQILVGQHSELLLDCTNRSLPPSQLNNFRRQHSGSSSFLISGSRLTGDSHARKKFLDVIF